MSDINLDFTVSNNSIDFTVQPNDITITPTDIQLTFSTNSLPLAGGSNTQLQYNNSDLLGGIPTATYDGTNLSLGNVANLKILGGTNGYVLQTDGSGNLDWTAMSGGGGNGTPGGSNTQIQYNDAGAFGGNTGFTFNEITGNVAIPGALTLGGNLSVSTYIAGILSTPSQTNITAVGDLATLSVVGNATVGNISSAGNANVANLIATTANITSLQLNSDNIALGNGAGANTGSSGQSVAIGYYAGYTNQGNDAIAIGDGAGGTNQGTSAIAIGSGAGYIGQGNNSIILNASGAQLNNNSANTFIVKPVRNANTVNALFYNASTGEISYDTAVGANYAAYAGNVTGNSQPNITSLGTLSSLSVTGNITSSGIFVGNGSGLSQLPGGNVTGSVANATYSTSTGNIPIVSNPVSGVYQILMASSNSNLSTTTFFNYNHLTGVLNTGPIAGVFAAGSGNQANITGLGTLTSLSVSGNITAGNINGGNITSANYLSGTLITGAQPNITSLGSLPYATTKIINTSGVSGTYDYDILSGSIQNIGALAGNIIVNLRGNSTTTFNSLVPLNSGMECVFCCYNNSGNSFTLTDVYIDGVDADVDVHGYPSIPYTPSTGTFLYFKITVSHISTTGSKYEAWVTALPMLGLA